MAIVFVLFCAIPFGLGSPPMEREDLFEGDLKIPELMVMSKQQEEMSNVMAARKNNQWPHAVIPYVISLMDQAGVNAIKSAMNEWKTKTCVRFISRHKEKNYIAFITGGGGCWSNSIGRSNAGKQLIHLGPVCWTHGICVHEIGHALGFWHEQSRPDRDNFIRIQWQNIRPGLFSQFRKYSRSIINSFDVPYDYESIMHYGKKAFSKNGKDTIVPIKTGVRLGQRTGLSKLDVQQANLMYKCGPTALPPTTLHPPTETATDRYIMHLESKTCFCPVGGHVTGENHPVVASRTCNRMMNVFMMYDNGTIQHLESGMCLHPTGNCILPEDNTELVLSKNCSNPKQTFLLLDNGLLKHLYSNTCARPANGVGNVPDDTRMVMHSKCDVEKFAFTFSASPPNAQNLALGKKTAQSTTFHDAVSSRAVDGKRNGNYKEKSCTHTLKSRHPWWRLDLGEQVTIASVFVSNRADCCWDRLSDFVVRVGKDLANDEDNVICGKRQSLRRGETKKIVCTPPLKGRYVNIVIDSSKWTYLTMCEVEVYSAVRPTLPQTSRPDPDIQGIIQHCKSKLCVSPKYKNTTNNTVVVLAASCMAFSALFRSLPDGSLQHIATGMCLSPKDGCEKPTTDTELVLNDHCGRNNTVFDFTNEGTLMHVMSKTCARPSSTPVSSKEPTTVILNSVCDATDHKFQFKSAPAPTPTSLPVSGNCGHVMIAAMIIGGVDTRPGAWPWQVLLKRFDGYSCGGSLIRPDWVLTAAHCISAKFSGKNYTVVLGQHDRLTPENTEVTIAVKKYYRHARYNRPYPINNDIALLQLVRPVKLNSRINTVCLPPQDYVVLNTSTCYITGWGKIRHPGTSHPILQEAKIPPVSNVICQEKLKKSPGASSLTITPNMLCAGKEGSKQSGCHGDSGGPYVCSNESGRWFLQGAVSWGSAQCNAEDRYTVFARIAKFRNWIDEHIEKIDG